MSKKIKIVKEDEAVWCACHPKCDNDGTEKILFGDGNFMTLCKGCIAELKIVLSKA